MISSNGARKVDAHGRSETENPPGRFGAIARPFGVVKNRKKCGVSCRSRAEKR
jgi:hypothetical protein